MLGKDVIIETLIRQGCDVTFGYPGGAVIPLFDSFLNYQGQIRNILVRHEQGAAHMAEGYAKVTGKPGVCIATSGPGATNLLTGIMDAYMDSVPMVAIGGQVPTHMVGNDAFQEADLMGMTLPITKHNWQITRPNDLAPTIVRAFRLSVTGRPGPVYLDIPKDVQQKEVTTPIPDEVYAYSTHRPHIKGDQEKLKQAADMVLHAERPLIVCGGGVVIANASHEMTRLAEFLHIPVTSTLMGKGGFPELHPLSLGVLGMHGHEVANWCVINSDVLLVVGCRFSDRITGDLSEYARDTKVIHIDIDPAELGKNVRPDIPIIADAKSALDDLYRICQEKLKKGNYTAWHQKIKELSEIHESIPDRDVKGISQKDICLAMNRAIRDDDIVTTGVGSTRCSPSTTLSGGGRGHG